MHSGPPRTRSVFLPAVALPFNTTPHNTTQNNSLFECIQGLRIQGLSACSYTTTQHNATQNNTKGVHIQGLPFCLQWHHHITQHNTAQLKTTLSLNAFRASTYNACLSACSRTNTPQNNSLLERFQGLRIQGLSLCLQSHHHTTQHNSKTTHSLNAFRASAYKACLSACSRTSEACMLRPMPSAMYALDNSGWLLPMAIAFLDHWMPCSYWDDKTS